MKSLIGLSGLALSTAVWAVDIQTQGELRWVTGGVGQSERAELAEIQADFSLKLLFASAEGHFFGDANVTIENAEGKQVFSGTSDGPYLYVNLPAGKYAVNAEVRDKNRRQSVQVPASGQAGLRFFWSYEKEQHSIVDHERAERTAPYEVLIIRDGNTEVLQAGSYEEVQAIEAKVKAENRNKVEAAEAEVEEAQEQNTDSDDLNTTVDVQVETSTDERGVKTITTTRTITKTVTTERSSELEVDAAVELE